MMEIIEYSINPKFPDEINKHYNQLKVLYEILAPGKTHYWCRCSCWNEIEVERYNLICGNTKSCGCLRKIKMLENRKPPTIKHGAFLKNNKKKRKLYHIWDSMRQRCNNPNNKEYNNYGGRGIKVCKEWQKDFSSFYKWAIKSGYKKGLSIDRSNNEKGYSPNNCNWATTSEQSRNKRTNKFFIIDGNKVCVKDLCDKYSCSKYKILRMARDNEIKYEYYSGDINNELKILNQFNKS